MEELNTPIFAQAKVEYTSQLVDILYPSIVLEIISHVIKAVPMAIMKPRWSLVRETI